MLAHLSLGCALESGWSCRWAGRVRVIVTVRIRVEVRIRDTFLRCTRKILT